MSPEIQLFWLRLAHTVIFGACLAALACLAIFAVSGAGRTAAIWSLVAPFTILAGLLINRGRCFLQTRARRLMGMDEGWARDIFFLPESWAVRVVKVFFPPFTLAVLGTLLRLAFA
ncbi:hypothetical protein V0U79_09790 [Hyphobacterium sp. HN65]|uniref:MFS transporter n=1 Tax=Hyphobacterium lacteum TaxID=3116575 RepID=A0ABU7LSU8_9PROT|nr:hypothetical protein [Hyphobacterium sp. HN65]MEE2526659.1 hypothetical protein [Hyphobacterium sp. HN65]